MKRVVVTGLGAITPIGNTLEAYRQGLQEGRSGANLGTMTVAGAVDLLKAEVQRQQLSPRS